MSRIFSVHSIFNLGYKVSYNSCNSSKYLTSAPEDVVKQLFNNRDKYIDPSKSLSLVIYLRDIKNDQVYRYLIKENTEKKYENLSVVDLNKPNNYIDINNKNKI